MKSLFLQEYMDEAVDALLRMNPDWNRKDVEKIVEREMKESFQNPTVEIDNNYTGQHEQSNLLSVFDYAREKKPIIAGNGTFYRNQEQAMNPIASMLKGILQKRKDFKKLMFKAGEDYGATSHMYKQYDLKQGIKKKLANS